MAELAPNPISFGPQTALSCPPNHRCPPKPPHPTPTPSPNPSTVPPPSSGRGDGGGDRAVTLHGKPRPPEDVGVAEELRPVPVDGHHDGLAAEKAPVGETEITDGTFGGEVGGQFGDRGHRGVSPFLPQPWDPPASSTRSASRRASRRFWRRSRGLSGGSSPRAAPPR